MRAVSLWEGFPPNFCVPFSSCPSHQVTIMTLVEHILQLHLTQFSPVSCYFLPLRPIQSAAGLLRSSADHRPGAPFPIPAEQKTVLPSPRRIRPSACNDWRTAGRIFLKFVVEEISLVAGRIVAKNRLLASSCPPVCPSSCICHRFPLNFDIAHFCENLPRHSEFGWNWSKPMGHITWGPKHVLLLPATLIRHKSALFEWNDTWLLG
jgi:hypothetical protein